MTTPRIEQLDGHSDRNGNLAAGSDTEREVVAVVVEWRGRVGLFRRSQFVAHDSGRWHCITGYIDPGNSPEQQAIQELLEETGLHAADLVDLESGRTLQLEGAGRGHWTVHTFRAATEIRRLQLNYEHDSHRWVKPRALSRFGNRVSWLEDVLHAIAQ
ncbi:NUDIX domain-containing protein [Streptomyces umbrinus]|uniref:NUDIX domain-containing protein n=1 Tax=Streptomyces umbrinus TaxID=67370 RepID=UPI0033FD5ED0